MRRLGGRVARVQLSGMLSNRSVSMTVRDALNTAMDEEIARDPNVFILGEEVGQYNGAYKVTKDLFDKYGGKRIIDTPITEMGFTGMAVGAAMNGLRPVVEFMTFNFSMQAIDQIVNSAAKGRYMSAGQLDCPIVFRGLNGPSAGVGAQHSQCFAPWYASVPGLIVVAPYDVSDARGLLKAAIRSDEPVVVLENEIMYGQSFEVGDDVLSKDYLLPFGKAKLERTGKDATIITFSRMTHVSLQAAEQLAARGIADVEVLNLRSLRPLDRQAIFDAVKRTHRIVIAEENWATCGVAAEIIAQIVESDSFDQLDAPIKRVSLAEVPMPYAANLERSCIPQVDDVVWAVTQVLK